MRRLHPWYYYYTLCDTPACSAVAVVVVQLYSALVMPEKDKAPVTAV